MTEQDSMEVDTLDDWWLAEQLIKNKIKLK